MIVALKDEERLSCAAHLLNTVLRNTFDPKKGCPDSITKTLTACKGLVKYFKVSSLRTLLRNSLQQSVETIWNWNYFMLVSVKKQFSAIRDVLLEHAPAELKRLQSVYLDVVEGLVKFLEVVTC